jgi:hypothetical protein
MFIFILFFIGVIIAERQRPEEKIRDAERHSRRPSGCVGSRTWSVVGSGAQTCFAFLSACNRKVDGSSDGQQLPKLVKHVTVPDSIRPGALEFGSRKVKVHQVAIKVAHRIISAHQEKLKPNKRATMTAATNEPRAPDDGICDGPDECDWISTEAVEWKLSCTVQWALVTFFMAMTLISCPDLGLILNSFFLAPKT